MLVLPLGGVSTGTEFGFPRNAQRTEGPPAPTVFQLSAAPLSLSSFPSLWRSSLISHTRPPTGVVRRYSEDAAQREQAVVVRKDPDVAVSYAMEPHGEAAAGIPKAYEMFLLAMDSPFVGLPEVTCVQKSGKCTIQQRECTAAARPRTHQVILYTAPGHTVTLGSPLTSGAAAGGNKLLSHQALLSATKSIASCSAEAAPHLY